MKLIRSTNREELDKSTVDIIKREVDNTLRQKSHVVLAVCGGRSVSGIFHSLKDAELPWSKIHIFMVDERLVPIDHEDSNFRLAKDGFIQHLIDIGKLPENNSHPFIFDPVSPDKGIGVYEAELRELGVYDIILLSSGEDGHIGALYPKHESFKNESPFFVVMHDSPKPPPDRMTLSRKLVLQSRAAILLILGEGKREAFEKFSDPRVSVEDCPAKLVQYVENGHILTDLE